MSGRIRVMVALLVLGCASTPRGPSDAELDQLLRQRLDEAIANPAMIVALFEPDARLALTNLTGPDGVGTAVEHNGIDEIRAMIEQLGSQPSFRIDYRGFQREGAVATHRGEWQIIQQQGTYTLTWRQNGDEWRIANWQFVGWARSP